MVKVLIKKLESIVKLPEYKTSGASGMDLVAFIKEEITTNNKKQWNTNSCYLFTNQIL